MATESSTQVPEASSCKFIGCSIKALPEDQWISAAEEACVENPANAPESQMLYQATDEVISPQHLALLTSKYWGKSGVRLTVSFLDDPEVLLRTRILSHMNAWAAFANVQFTEVPSSGQVRISREVDGYWSYLGTDIKSIRRNRATMNLESFSMDTPELEFKRVIRHETGHTLGFPHEHMRPEIVDQIDRKAAIDYFGRTQGWTPDQVIAQVLTPLNNAQIIRIGEADEESIMCYSLPAEIMEDNVAVLGGMDINASDGELAGRVYPLKDKNLV
ncbi:hypothetical protein LTR56_004805 [Elasticomyces elasticus]|nr:hypothetical protein LTR56_004805 [Elasticomyces elasticus]KAK3664579.1 hypothetical protein LTR22_004447 [Elasticomyces elasticus]KAK4918453.1 hypothetical protein LTR49_013845 [Elasticomyces elasticus]KAK5760289.1 hypothetical protein LTS12_009503 [Elasticomyces elasticus]